MPSKWACIRQNKYLRFFLSLGLLLLVLYVIMVPSNALVYDLILFPCPDPRIPNVAAQFKQIEKFGISRKEIVLTSSNGKHLQCWFFELPGTRTVFLFNHGKGNNIYGKLNVAQSLLACGGSVLMYDYQGYGKSEGRATLQNACDDGVAAYDYLIQKEHRSPKDIVGFGESLGSGVTGQLVKKRQLAAVILQSGFASLKSAGADSLFWLRLYPDRCFPQQMMDNVEVFSRPHPPLLIIHGRKDKTVKYENALQLYNSAIPVKTMLTLTDGGHGSVGAHNEFYIAVRKFLKQNNL